MRGALSSQDGAGPREDDGSRGEKDPRLPRPEPSTLVWRRLGPSDLDAVERLHRQALRGTGPDIVKPETPDFFARLLGGRGAGIGVFDDAHLIAYGLIQHDLPAYDDPRPLVGAAPGVAVVKLSGASVDPAYRGRGLQRALIAARVTLARENADGALPLLFSTSAPANVPSWTNLLSERFAVRAVKLYYGGHPRYVMVREGDAPLPHGTLHLPAGAIEAQSSLLAQGWRGVAMEAGADGPGLLLAPPMGARA